MEEKSFKVRDLRKKTQFIIDDEYLNGYAKLVSPYATLAYLSLCRHADKRQVAFPSYDKIAKEFDISYNSAQKGIEELVNLNIISKKRMGKRLCNEYQLKDKSEWVSKEKVEPYKNKRKFTLKSGDAHDTGNTIESGDAHDTEGVMPMIRASDAHDTGTKETQEKDAHKKVYASEVFEAEINKQISSIINLFKNVNPLFDQLFKRKVERDSARDLIKADGYEKVFWIAEHLPVFMLDKFFPGKPTKPSELKRNYARICAYIVSRKIELEKDKNRIASTF